MYDTCVRWLHIGDLHVSNEDGWESADRLRLIVDEMRQNVSPGALDFAFLPGDNANHGAADQYSRIAAALHGLNLPLHIIPGDHDFEPGSLAALARIPGAHARPVSVPLRGRRGLFLDIVSAGGGGPDFRLGDDQRRWLEAELHAAAEANEAGPLVFMHAFPCDMGAEGAWLAEIFAHAGVAFVDTGHTHYNELLNDGRVIHAATRSTGQVEEGPFGFSIAAVDGDAASWKFKAAGSDWPFVLITAPADERLTVEGARPLEGRDLTVRALVLGKAITRVALKIDGDAWRPMSPLVDDQGVWSGRVAALALGLHDIRVAADSAGGGRGEDHIRLRLPVGPRRSGPLGAHASSVAPWPERGLLGTRLGPNANGRQW